ncbi:MAG: hypothetical protein HY304_01775 [candidate division Zixibacteria bacterium]|nr:hypothetical protein [candidate division Zixibacteria bacterium]
MGAKYRQEVFNVLLAQLLQERGVLSAPESILRPKTLRGHRMPDVLVDFNGLRTVIEGEIDTSPEAAERALASARRRVEEGIAHIAIGVLYPESLQAVGFRALKDELGACRLRMAIVTEATPTTPEFVAGTVDDLETALRLAFDQLIGVGNGRLVKGPQL